MSGDAPANVFIDLSLRYFGTVPVREKSLSPKSFEEDLAVNIRGDKPLNIFIPDSDERAMVKC